MAAKFTHSMTKAAQKVAFSKTKKSKKIQTILAPAPMLMQRVILKNGTRGTVRQFHGQADHVTYTLVDEFGTRHDFTREDVASYK